MPVFWQRPRLMHLGRFPMEKIKRVSETTTKISDSVPRSPKRAHFFQRARFGDLGPKPQQEVRRFPTKHPLSMSMGKVTQTQATVHDGDVAPEIAPLPEDLQEVAEHIKATCYFLDDALCYGKRKPIWKWWLDLEIRDGKVSKPTNTNHRDLRLGRPVPKDRIIPIYPIDSIHPPGSHEPHPLDRQAAQARSAKK